MSNVNVTFADMKDAAGRLRNGQHEMETKLQELGTIIDNLVGSGFVTDQASGAYQEQFHQFQTGTKQAVDALEGLATYLEKAADALADTDTQLANSIKS